VQRFLELPSDSAFVITRITRLLRLSFFCIVSFCWFGCAQELQAFYQKQREEAEEKENEQILDVIRGDARRRKAAGQEDSWVPNRAARQRGMALGQVPVGFTGAMMQNEDDDFEDAADGDTTMSAAHAAERMERLKWIQGRKQLENEQAQQEQEKNDAEVDIRVETDGTSRGAAPIRRFNSRSAPALSAFSRQLSGVKPSAAPKIEIGGEEGEDADPVAAAAGGAKRWRKVSNAFSLTRSLSWPFCALVLCVSVLVSCVHRSGNSSIRIKSQLFSGWDIF